MKNKKILCDDLIFKYVFSHELFLRDFINSYFEYAGISNKVRYVKGISQALIQAKSKGKKDYYGDIAGALDNGWLFSLESYNAFYREQYVKSLMYMARIYSSQLKKNDLYRNAKKVININLIHGNYHKCNPNLVNIKRFVDTVNICNKDDDLEMVLVRLDKFSKSKYNKSDECRFIKYLRLFNATSLEEMEELTMDDKIFKQIKEVVDEYLNDPLIDSIRDNHKIEMYQSEEKGFKKGKKEGIKEGKREGIKENQAEIVRNMLQKDYDDNAILDITGIKLYELDELKREMKNTYKRKLSC